MSLKIPLFKSINGWEKVPINECGEKLVPLNTLDTDKILVEPEYFNKKIPGAIQEQYLRADAAKRLIQAAIILQQLNKNYKLFIFDAYRSLKVQRFIFNKQLVEFRTQHPSWSEEKLNNQTQRYVSSPSVIKTRPSPHATGGAIDLTIVKNGIPLKMAPSGFDDASDISRTDYFEKTNKKSELKFRNNRRILYYCMTEAGFTNYPEEWWHFDYGNQFWGKVSNRDAFYGLAK